MAKNEPTTVNPWMEGQYSELETASRDWCDIVGIDPNECPCAGSMFADIRDKPWWKYCADDLAEARLKLSVLRRHGLIDV